ncbi:HD domain-containing protein [Alkaliphilus sp. B6464]|uniref:HD domain-containing protein n=1 Tax=Alkaliphilus sp. B6464 TaxID=2731219 RepID=UPI001BA6F427|nr:HD domain-containing protein [Alkaliphilus sp. B6464]QUH22155.1 HD domain-containing protein [Alkaliphilus sp. B6464]
MKVVFYIKDYLLKQEANNLSKFACLSKNATRVKEDINGFQLPFTIDIQRIINSKSFRRLKHKTQVFLNPRGDHYRTRLTHTLEVVETAKFIARYLRLNEDLTAAIGYGHDIGHSPFSHAGEAALEEYFGSNYSHNKQSLRVADVVENMNLTNQVRDGILNHTGKIKPMTLEGQIVKIADRIAYLHHDIDDAIRGKIITYDDIPTHLRELFNSIEDVSIVLSLDIIESSLGKDEIKMSRDIENAMLELRSYMFETIYERESSKREVKKAKDIVISLTEYYLKHPEKMPEKYLQLLESYSKETAVIDFISGMTDVYAIAKFEEIFIPQRYDIL